jgi:DNA-binding transcriptional MerR regulator
MDELVGRVARALAAGDVRAPNGRVTEVPDGRVIRWYATIGLVDRPSGTRGRTALYGRRHVLQLVAIKRLQAQGHSLAEIQAALGGATEATLRRVADVPSQVLTDPAQAPRGRFDEDAGSAARARESAGMPGEFGAPGVFGAPGAFGADGVFGGDEAPPPGSASAPRPRFWARTEPAPVRPGIADLANSDPAASDPAGSDPAESNAAGSDPADSDPADSGPAHGGLARPHGAHRDSRARDRVEVLHGVALGPATVLLVPGEPTEDDLSAIRAATRPLLDLLAARGLLTSPGKGA